MPQTLDHLEDNIRRVIADIRPQMLKKVIENWTSRLDYIRASPTRGLLATDHVILNHGQETWTTPELAPPLLTTTPHQRQDVSALDRFNEHRVFSGTGIELMTYLPRSDTLTTGLPQPRYEEAGVGVGAIHFMTDSIAQTKSRRVGSFSRHIWNYSPNLEMEYGITRQIWEWYMQLVAKFGNDT
ncbi:uncharacterized protein TNCV_1855171 [Trichonephila clavipes]|nr:uncharacterized protein TNCV_1855171 [Trichonephila clavipes]